MPALAGGSSPWLRRSLRFVAESRLPLAVWAAVTGAVLGAAAYARGNPFRSRIWAHSDSHLYLAQASHGITFVACHRATEVEWCGNAGWFPGYPWAIDLLQLAGAPARGSGVAIAWAFGAATLVLLWWTFLQRQATYANVAALLYAAVAPGIAFRYGIYPISMLGFFTVSCLWLLARHRIVLAGLAGAAAVCSYPVGLALLPAAGVWLLASGAGRTVRERARETAVACGLILAGLAVVLGSQWIEVGHPNAYFLVQDKYNHTFRQPLAPLHGALHAIAHGSPLSLRDVPHVELVVLSLTLLALLGASVLRRVQARSEGALIAIWALLAWLLTSVPADLSHYREDAVLLPLAPLVGRLPRPLAAAAVVAAACLTVPMTILYVRGELP